MSGIVGSIGTGLAALNELLGSRSRLRPASFRGVPFLVDATEGIGGRRLITHLFPLRDTPYTEDLGRLPRSFRFSAWVIDPLPGTLLTYASQPTGDWIDQRDALLDAIEGHSDAATLVHPTIGELPCRAGILSWREQITERWGACRFELEFVQDGPKPSPASTDDTASSLLSAVQSALPLIAAAYETVALAIVSPGALLGGLVDNLLGLPLGTIDGLYTAITACAASPTDTTATAAAVQTAFQAMAANVAAGQLAPFTPTDDPVAGTPFATAVTGAVPPDPSGGLVGLATFGATLAPIAGVQMPGGPLPATPAVTPSPAALAQGVQQAAVAMLVQNNAVAAMATVYAQATWPSANAADAARTQLLSLLDAQSDAAAAAGQDDLYRAWQAITAVAMTDMIARAQSLPTLGPYSTPMSLPSLVLAQRLYRDPTRAAELEDLNDVPHPLFMPATGLALSV